MTARPASTSLVDLCDVSYTYEGEDAPVLRNVSLRVEEGEFILILGPSGCGKSTLLQLLNGTIPHTLRGALSGEATICDRPLVTTKVAAFATDVGMVFQDPDLQIICTRVRDEVCFGLENLCRPASEILDRQGEALRLVGLDGFGDRSVFDLSGGQKQRVSIAAVLAVRPRLLVLDEPTANLDPAGMAEVFALLQTLHEAGATIVMVEHRVDELADRISRVVMMDGGRITFDGSPRAAFARSHLVDSEDGQPVPVSAWRPQATEFALALASACGVEVKASEMPLDVSEAVELGRRFLGSAHVSATEAVPVATASDGPPICGLIISALATTANSLFSRTSPSNSAGGGLLRYAGATAPAKPRSRGSSWASSKRRAARSSLAARTSARSDPRRSRPKWAMCFRTLTINS